MLTTTRVEELVRREVEAYEPFERAVSPREIVNEAIASILHAIADRGDEPGTPTQQGKATLERILRLTLTSLLDLECS